MQGKGLHICIFADERSIHVRRWVSGLRGLGHDVDLITLRKEPSSDIGGINLGASGKLTYLAKIPKLRREVAKLSPDIFHAHYASSYGFLASFLNHPRKVVSVWGNDVIDFPGRSVLHKAIIKRSLESARHITATSEFLKAATSKFEIKPVPITVIPFGIDLNLFKFCERRNGNVTRVGIAKHLHPKYGIDYLLRAFAAISRSHSDLELLIVGKGPSENEYRALVGNLNLGNKVKFMGALPHEKVAQFLMTLDIFAMPSISDGESFGVAALEASATGLPVVATRVGGVPEVVIENITGMLVDRASVEQLSRALLKLIDEPDLRRKMGQAGRRFVEERYRWEDNLRAMSELYYKLMP
jgi:glycosyltransferase involved in cell wall biosynthesis